MNRVAIIGLGEVGRIFVEDLAALGGEAAAGGEAALGGGRTAGGVAGRHSLAVWDTGFAAPDSPASTNAAQLGIAPATSAAAAVDGAELVISAVTAANCVDAATAAAAGIAPGGWFFDLNSSSPGHKQQAAQIVDGAGGRYVEAALMSPIGPRRLSSPFLLGGPHAAEFARLASGWGLEDVTVVSGTVGRAAATKLCRSVVVKGMESLLTEALLAARRHGVEREVLDSLSNVLPPADWEAVAGYFLSRSLRHGRRRSEEMTEAAATVAEAGVEPLLATATAARQAWTAQHPHALAAGSTIGMLDGVLAAIERFDTRTEEPKS